MSSGGVLKFLIEKSFLAFLIISFRFALKLIREADQKDLISKQVKLKSQDQYRSIEYSENIKNRNAKTKIFKANLNFIFLNKVFESSWESFAVGSFAKSQSKIFSIQRI
jgi:hypothetical protein